MKPIWLVVIFLGLQLLARPAAVFADAPTPAPQTQPSQEGTVSPIVGILVLAAPLAFMVWKSANKKGAPKITAASCLPVIDEDHRPEPRSEGRQPR